MVQFDDGPRKATYNPSKAHSAGTIAIKQQFCALDAITCELNLKANHTQLFEAFWALYLPQPSMVGFAATPDPADRWARLTQGMATDSNMIRDALLALSTYKLGSTNNDAALVQRGMLLYGESLSRIARQLERPSKMNHLELLSTCRLLALYEVNSHEPYLNGAIG